MSGPTITTVKMLPIAGLQPYGDNPRRGNVDLIANSLQTHGQYRPIVVNIGTHTGRDFEVLAGNHTLAAADSLGWEEISAALVDVDEQTARKIVLVDNRSNDVATYDQAALVELLEALDGDLDGTGFDDEELADLLAHLRDDDLDDLADEYGEPGEDDLWPTIKIKVPQDLYDRFMAHLEAEPGGSEVAKFRALVDELSPILTPEEGLDDLPE